MKPEIAKKWAEALRSDKYIQGKYALKNNRGQYCCLGVLCDIYRQETGDGQWLDDDDIPAFALGDDSSDTYDSFLPPEVRDWANMVTVDGTFAADALPETLTHANDSGSSFEDIARIIEEHVEEL